VESNGIKQVPPNPVSMYLFAKTISEAMSSVKEMNNQTTKHKHLQGIIELIQNQNVLLLTLNIASLHFLVFLLNYNSSYIIR